jgi:hypothetical protein
VADLCEGNVTAPLVLELWEHDGSASSLVGAAKTDLRSLQNTGGMHLGLSANGKVRARLLEPKPATCLMPA